MKSDTGLLDYIRLFLNILPDKKDRRADIARTDELKNFISDSGLVLFQLDLQGQWQRLDNNWTAISGYDVAESLHNDHFACIHPDDLHEYRNFFLEILYNKTRCDSIRARIICKNGEYKWVEITAGVLLCQHTGKIAGIIGILRDIHLQQLNEHRTNVQLQFLEKLIDCVPGMIYRGLNNANWTMEFISSGCYEVTGYLPEELIHNKKISYASLIHPDDRQYVWNEVQCALDECRTFDLTYRIITAHGIEKWVWERGQGIFSSSGELLVLEGYIADITKAKQADEFKRTKLLYDKDSNSPKWAIFNDRVSEAIRRTNLDERYGFVFILLQIDKYEEIVSIYGKQTCSALTTELQRKIVKYFGNTGSVSRADESTLGILLESIDGFKNLNKLIQNIHEIILLPVNVYDYEIYVTASLGVTLSTKRYSSSNDLIYDAEQALSRAKALGGARHEVFDLRQHAKAAAQYKYEEEIRSAVQREAMHVWWQPVVDLKSWSLAGLEAKLVWNHPQRGNLFAEDFVPRITDTQLLMQLWEFMLSEVCYYMKEWKTLSYLNGVDINIQIFGESLLAADSILRLGESLLESRPSFCSISLGIPEDVLLQATDTVKEMLGWLQSKKISIILDSFGQGLCSLSVLKNYPLDMTRLHPSLLDREHYDPHVVKSIVSLVHSFKIPVIAAGLADRPKLDAAIEYNIDYVQGPIISAPLSSSQIPEAFKKDFSVSSIFDSA